MPAIPALITAGGALGSTLLGGQMAKSAAKKAGQRSPEETALFQSQTNLANQQQQQGSQLFGSAMPQIQSTIDYYRTLLDGSRAARMSAVSGEAQDTGQAYSGAEAGINKNLRGGERDAALAENSTSRAGAISRLVTGVRPQAAGALGGLGTQLLGQSGGFSGQAGNINAGLLGNSTQNRQQGQEVGREAGSNLTGNLGQLFGNLLSGFGGGGKKGPGSLVPALEGGRSISGNLPASSQIPY